MYIFFPIIIPFNLHSVRHSIHSKIERRQKLFDQYFFHCQCEACSNNYPTNDMMCTAKFRDIVFCFNPAMDELTNIINYLKQFDHHYPCSQLWIAHEYFMRRTNIEFGNVTLFNPYTFRNSTLKMIIENQFSENMGNLLNI